MTKVETKIEYRDRVVAVPAKCTDKHGPVKLPVQFTSCGDGCFALDRDSMRNFILNQSRDQMWHDEIEALCVEKEKADESTESTESN